MIFSVLKYLFFGIILLLLFHFETLSIGPVKISHLWKGSLLLFLVFGLLRRERKNYFLYKPLLWLSVIQLINVELIINPFNAILLFGTTLILPLLGIYVLKYSPNQLQNGLLFFASFFILCFLPYSLGILESYGERYELAGYGSVDVGIIGPFQGSHAASTTLAGSFLVILYFWFAKSYNRIYLSLLLLLGFYFLIFTYVRTGMAMVAVGSLVFIFYFAKKQASTRMRLIFIVGLFAFLISSWVLSNEVMMERITGERIAAGTSETDSFEDLGSGRGGIYLNAFEIYVEANLAEQIIGTGQTEAMNRMNAKIGKSLLAHNGFLLLLLNNGLLGFILFLSFLFNLNKFQKRILGEHSALIRALIFSYITMTFFQNWDILYMYLILILGIAFSFNFKRQYLNS